MSTRQAPTEAEFLSALAFIDVYYGTRTPPDDPTWSDARERAAHVAHARGLGWKPPLADKETA